MPRAKKSGGPGSIADAKVTDLVARARSDAIANSGAVILQDSVAPELEPETEPVGIVPSEPPFVIWADPELVLDALLGFP